METPSCDRARARWSGRRRGRARPRGGDGRKPAFAGGAAAPASADKVLLAAARAAERQSVGGATGEYWWARTVDGTAWQVGPRGDRYVVEERFERQIWQRRTRKRGYEEVMSVRSLGARPQTKADVAAWRRDGSPTRWSVTESASGSDGATRLATRELHLRPSPAEVTRTSIPCLVVGHEPVPKHGTCARVTPAQSVPTDPDRLARLLSHGRVSRDPAGATGALFLLAGGQILSQGGPLFGRPVSPEERAAVFRALADLPGVRLLGAIRDPLERRGIAITTSARRDGGPPEVERRLVVDPATGTLLAVVDVAAAGSASGQWARPGSPVSWAALVQAGWTGKAPRLRHG
jgi:hypothetical protein